MQSKRFIHWQLGFIQGNSCVTQLLQLPYKNFGILRLILGGRSLIFLTFELKTYCVDDNLLTLIRKCLSGRRQRVFLNDQTSPCKNILLDISRGSVLGTLSLLIYINYLPSRITDGM